MTKNVSCDSGLVSIVIPIYKTDKYLERCIQSAVDQTYRNIEIILVDDGSPDRCPVICDQWEKRDSRIKVIHKQHGGVSSARNTGIDYSTGESLFFLDSDDCIHSQCIELLAECMTEHHADYVIGEHGLTIQDFEKNKIIIHDNVRYQELSVEGFFKEGIEKGFVTGHLIKRKTIGSARFDKEIRLGEDWIFNLKLLMRGPITYSLVQQPLYCYVYHEDSAAANERGYEGYYLSANWCNDSIDQFADSMRGYALKEGLKKSILYRFEMEKHAGGKHCIDNKKLIRALLNKMMKENSVSMKEKAAYSILGFFPFTYKLFVKIHNNKKRSI